MNNWISMLQDAAGMFLFLAVELSVLFIVISAGVSLIRGRLRKRKIKHAKAHLQTSALRQS